MHCHSLNFCYFQLLMWPVNRFKKVYELYKPWACKRYFKARLFLGYLKS